MAIKPLALPQMYLNNVHITQSNIFCLFKCTFIYFFTTGIAYRGLQGKKLYPVVSSTAARSGMKVIKCRSFKTSLQFMCCQVLRTVIPRHLDVLQVIAMPPGLREFLENNISWLLQPNPVESIAPSYSDVFRSRGTKRKYSSSEEDCDDGPSSSKSSR